MCSKTCEEKSKGSRGGKRKDQLKRFGTSSRCLGITRHPCDKTHALFVRPPSAAESCENMGRRRPKRDVNRSTRRRHFTGSNRKAPKKNNSRSSDVSGQSESASRRTCKWRSPHLSRQGYFKHRCSLGTARQDKSSCFHMARGSLERRYGELRLQRSKVDVEQRGAEGD